SDGASFQVCEQHHEAVDTGTVHLASWRTMQVRLPWTLGAPRRPGLPWLSWLLVEKTILEVVNVTDDGQLCWARLKLFTPDAGLTAASRAKGGTRFICAAITRPGQVAGVHGGG